MADFKDVAIAGSELAITIGIIEAALDEAPDEVKENFDEKVQAVTEYLHGEILEFQQFGEAYDPPEN
jgi:hypothetical protein